MRTIPSTRQHYYQNLSTIAKVTGDPYFRRMSYVEADSWLAAFNHEAAQGYPHEMACSRAWDFYFAGRQVFGANR